MKIRDDIPDVVTYYEVRRTGTGEFYLVSLDSRGHSENLYLKGKLLTFDYYQDATAYKERFTKQLRGN